MYFPLLFQNTSKNVIIVVYLQNDSLYFRHQFKDGNYYY